MAEQMNLLEMIRQQTPRVIQAVQNAGAVAVDNSMKAEATVADIEKTYQQAGQDQALVVRTAQIGNMQAQQAGRKALEAAGGMDALYQTISTLRAEQQRLVPELERLREENLASSGFSPISWIKQIFDVNGTQAKIASSVGAINTVSAVGAEIEQRINAAGVTARNTAETITTASIEAATRAAQTEWQVRAAQARLEGLKYNTQSMEAIASAEDRTLEVLTRAANFERGEQQFQLALREEARRREQFNWQKEAATAARAEKLDEKGFEERTQYYVNLAEAARGLPLSQGLEWKDRLRLFKTGASKELEDLYLKGRLIATTGVSFIGTSAADTARVIASTPGGLNLPEERKKALALVTEAQAELAIARGTPGSPLADDKDGSKAAAFINRRVSERVTGYVSNVGNNLDNPFHLGDLSSYIGTATSPGVGAFQSYPLVQKILNPAIAGNISLTDPNTVVGLAQAAVAKGELTSSQAAADISNIYRRANLLHRRAVGFETLGIAMPANGNGYVAKINGKLVDVTDFNAVARAMNVAAAQEAYKTYKQTSFGAREATISTVRNIPLRGGSNITYTPEAQAAGTARAREDMIRRGQP